MKENLVEAGNDVIVSEEQSCDSALVELVWRERLPLGMSLLMNDDSGILKVVDFPRGSQARIVCEKRGFDPDAFRSASVMAVNGSFFDDQEDLFQALKDPGRPKTVLFRLADTEDAERLRKLLEGDRQSSPTEEKPRNFSFREVRFESDGELGIQFESAFDNAGLVVAGFVEGDDGTVLAAQRSGQIKTGDLLSHVNGTPVYGLEGDARSQAIDILHSAAINRPLSLSFISYYMQKVTVTRVIPGPGVDSSGGPTELDLRENLDGDKRRVVIRGFNCVSGMAEAGGILIGDQLVFVNGFPVGAGCRWLDTPSIPTIVEVFDMLTNVSFYPIGLTFARPKQHASRWTISAQGLSDVDVETICITATSHARLGIMLENTDGSDVVVSDFLAVPGVFQRSLESCKDQSGNVCLTIDSINGQFVPSYASADMVRNALGRSWKGEDAIDLVLCDDDLKQWISSQIP